MVSRLAKIKAAVDSFPYNHLQMIEGASLGIITSGISYNYVLEALSWLGLKDKFSVLKIGTPYPLPEKLINKLLQTAPTLLVVEELEPFLENHIKVIAQESGLRVDIHGKDIIPLISELSTRKVTEAISKVTKVALPVDFTEIDRR